MNPIALLSGHSPFPNLKEFRRAKTYGFWCEVCLAAYALWVPDELSLGQAEACQKIGRNVCTKEHPHHSEQIDIPLGAAISPSVS
jgi:hypothetical protein